MDYQELLDQLVDQSCHIIMLDLPGNAFAELIILLFNWIAS